MNEGTERKNHSVSIFTPLKVKILTKTPHPSKLAHNPYTLPLGIVVNGRLYAKRAERLAACKPRQDCAARVQNIGQKYTRELVVDDIK